jgi:thiol-disulfide isomerase/thioredoxin
MRLGDKSMAMGTKLPVGIFDGEVITSRDPDDDTGIRVPFTFTDLIERFRQSLDAPPEKSSHRILRELDGKIVKLPKGRKHRLDPRRPPEFLALYFSAGWCGPCHGFSPVLKRFYERNKKHVGRRFELVWVSSDRSEAAMQEYLSEYEFPWLAVAWPSLPEVPVTRALNIHGIPCVVVLDERGRLIAHSYVDGDYVGPQAVLDELQKRLDSRN